MSRGQLLTSSSPASRCPSLSAAARSPTSSAANADPRPTPTSGIRPLQMAYADTDTPDM